MSNVVTLGAGEGFAGADQALLSAMAVVPRSQLVPMFDIRTRSFPRDAKGNLKLVHWVDQCVALALGIRLGSLKSQPGLGNRIRDIKRAAGPTLVSNVQDAVRECLIDLTSRKDIGVTQVLVRTPVRSQILVTVSYINLRLTPFVPQDVPFVL